MNRTLKALKQVLPVIPDRDRESTEPEKKRLLSACNKNWRFQRFQSAFLCSGSGPLVKYIQLPEMGGWLGDPEGWYTGTLLNFGEI
jgi:hypothetical protein